MTTIDCVLSVFMCRLRYGHGCVRDIAELKSYEVQFEDGTICSDMSREDIIVSCVEKGRTYTITVTATVHVAVVYVV